MKYSAIFASVAMILSGCSSVLGNKDIDAPSFAIEFAHGSSRLNNHYQIYEKIDSGVSGISGDKKYVLVVASANSTSEYELSVERFYNIYDSYLPGNNDVLFRLIVQPLEREEQADLMPVYFSKYWNLYNKSYALNTDISRLPENEMVFESGDERYLMLIPKRMTFVPNLSDDGLQNLSSLISMVGWSGSFDEGCSGVVKNQTINFVSIGDVASSYEMGKILDKADAFYKCSPKLDIVNKKVFLSDE